MAYFLFKVLVSALIIATASELAKRSAVAGAVLVSLPLVSILAMTWLYLDTGDSTRAAVLSNGVLWLIPPSMLLFMLLPLLIHRGLGYWAALAVSMAATVAGYTLMLGIRRWAT